MRIITRLYHLPLYLAPKIRIVCPSSEPIGLRDGLPGTNVSDMRTSN